MDQEACRGTSHHAGRAGRSATMLLCEGVLPLYGVFGGSLFGALSGRGPSFPAGIKCGAEEAAALPDEAFIELLLGDCQAIELGEFSWAESEQLLASLCKTYASGSIMNTDP